MHEQSHNISGRKTWRLSEIGLLRGMRDNTRHFRALDEDKLGGKKLTNGLEIYHEKKKIDSGWVETHPFKWACPRATVL